MGQIVIIAAGIALALLFRAEAAGYPHAAAELPDILGIVLILLALVGIAQAALRLRRKAAAGEPAVAAPDWAAIGTGGAFLTWVVLYAASISWIGYVIATPLFLAVPLALLRPVGPVGAVATVVVVTGVVLGVFAWFLNLTIPLYPAF